MKFKTSKDSPKILEFMNNLDFFNKFPLELPDKIQIVSKCELEEFSSNSIIFSQWDEAERLIFLKRGLLKVYRKIKFKIHPKTHKLILTDCEEPTPS